VKFLDIYGLMVELVAVTKLAMSRHFFDFEAEQKEKNSNTVNMVSH
jgi:hypothetical protein